MGRCLARASRDGAGDRSSESEKRNREPHLVEWVVIVRSTIRWWLRSKLADGRDVITKYCTLLFVRAI